MKTNPANKFLTVKEFDTTNTIVIARNKVISAEPVKVYINGQSTMGSKVKLSILGRPSIIVDVEPTQEVLQSMMPL